jgi:hypothetical protein
LQEMAELAAAAVELAVAVVVAQVNSIYIVTF